MNSDSQLKHIMRKTGRKPVACKCKLCKEQCTRSVCLGTPQDIEKLIDAGYGDKIKITTWAAGIRIGVTTQVITMFQAQMTESGCIFLKDGLCTLHDKGLKPTEGKLSHHSITEENYTPKKGVTWNVAKEWLDKENETTILRVALKLMNNGTTENI
jgi:hypothetical protein